MNQFMGRSLDIEEPMTPKEKIIKTEFLGKANTLRVCASAQRYVNASISYATVVDAMHKEFSIGLGGSAPVKLDTLNQTTINNLHESFQKHLKAVAHTREIGFENSRIPTNMLPRPSFNLQEDDETTGKHQVILR